MISTPVSIYWSVSFKGQNADTSPSQAILSSGTEPTKIATIQQDLDLPMFLTTEPQDHPHVPCSGSASTNGYHASRSRSHSRSLSLPPNWALGWRHLPQTICSFLDEVSYTITNHSDLHDLALAIDIPISKVDKAITDNPGSIENCGNQVIFMWWGLLIPPWY